MIINEKLNIKILIFVLVLLKLKKIFFIEMHVSLLSS